VKRAIFRNEGEDEAAYGARSTEQLIVVPIRNELYVLVPGEPLGGRLEDFKFSTDSAEVRIRVPTLVGLCFSGFPLESLLLLHKLVYG
jgi:hypothetical protein